MVCLKDALIRYTLSHFFKKKEEEEKKTFPTLAFLPLIIRSRKIAGFCEVAKDVSLAD